MTTIVVVRKGQHACIASDTMTRLGDSRQSAEFIANHEKIFRVEKNYIAITGSSASYSAIKNYFKRHNPKPKLEDTDSIFETLLQMHETFKKEYFLNPKEDDGDPFESSQIWALLANPHGIFGIFSLRSVQEYAKYYAFGSGAEYALGAMHASYDRLKTPEAIAKAGIEAALEFDTGSAAPIISHKIKLKTKKS